VLRGQTILIPQHSISTSEDTVTEGKDTHLKVLVCEDNPELAAYITSLLHKCCQVRLAKDGEEGMALVNAWSPELVLTDAMMPRKDGITLCREIKSNPATSKIIVVLLTALTHRDAMLRGWEAKADEYLFKPFHPEELVTRIQSLLDGIKERRIAADVIEKQQKKLEQVNADLEAFSYSASHDLRAPLRHIDGFASVLAEDSGAVLSEPSKRALSKIILNARRMQKLIDDLLVFSKVEREGVRRVSVDMNQMVNSILSEMLEITSAIQIHPLCVVKADVNMIRQVWVNLISNAVKYSNNKADRRIEIGATLNDSMATFYVRDNGVGFDMQYYDKLFGAFQRLHNVQQFDGTGVGLAIVDRIVKKHEGKVWAEGEIDKGATFYFSLPLN
jgi:signal transduction histidine kinase